MRRLWQRVVVVSMIAFVLDLVVNSGVDVTRRAVEIEIALHLHV